MDETTLKLKDIRDQCLEYLTKKQIRLVDYIINNGKLPSYRTRTPYSRYREMRLSFEKNKKKVILMNDMFKEINNVTISSKLTEGDE